MAAAGEDARHLAVQAGRSATSPTVSDALTRSNAKRAERSCLCVGAHQDLERFGALRNIAIEKSTPTTRAAPVRASSGRYRPEPVPTSSALLGPSVRRIDWTISCSMRISGLCATAG